MAETMTFQRPRRLGIAERRRVLDGLHLCFSAFIIVL
jgi:hypothetical protein